jgi:toxic protein SymE
LSYNYSTIKSSRKLKIYKKYQARTYGSTTIPQIIPEGKWLDKLGFKHVKMVNVEQKKNHLTITIEKVQNY